MTEFYAAPYSAPTSGFYFKDDDSYQKEMKKLKKRGYEEVEVQFIDGTNEEVDLYQAMESAGMIGQWNIQRWFDDVEPLADHEQAALYGTIEAWGIQDLDEALTKADEEARPREGSVEDYAHEIAEDSGMGPRVFTNWQSYFDYEAFGRDLRIEGSDTAHLEDDLATAESELEDAQTELKEAKEGGEDDTSYEESEVEEAEERVDDLKGSIKEIENQTDQERGEGYIDGVYGDDIPEELAQQYFDWESIARDMELGGDVSTFTFGGTEYVMDNQ
jgi:antirestriction protein